MSGFRPEKAETGQLKTTLARYVLTEERLRFSAPMESYASRSVFCFAGAVDAWIFRLSRRRRADSPSANHCSDFFSGAPFQGSHRLARTSGWHSEPRLWCAHRDLQKRADYRLDRRLDQPVRGDFGKKRFRGFPLQRARGQRNIYYSAGRTGAHGYRLRNLDYPGGDLSPAGNRAGTGRGVADRLPDSLVPGGGHLLLIRLAFFDEVQQFFLDRFAGGAVGSNHQDGVIARNRAHNLRPLFVIQRHGDGIRMAWRSLEHHQILRAQHVL